MFLLDENWRMKINKTKLILECFSNWDSILTVKERSMLLHRLGYIKYKNRRKTKINTRAMGKAIRKVDLYIWYLYLKNDIVDDRKTNYT